MTIPKQDQDTKALEVAEVLQPAPFPTRDPTHIERMLSQAPMEQAKLMMEAGEALRSITEWALSQTESKHWDNMGGKPRLNKLGAKHVAKMTGLTVETFGSRQVEAGVDEAGPWYRYECNGRVSSPWSPSVVSCQGSCDSRHKFHTTRYKGQGNNRQQYKLEAHQVHRSNIAQQAQTNCHVRGVTEYLGLDGLKWPDVEKYTKARQEHSASVSYGDQPEQAPAAPAPRAETDPATGAERTAVWMAYAARREIDPKAPPEGEGVSFQQWVVKVGGTLCADKRNWTMQQARALKEAALQGEGNLVPYQPPQELSAGTAQQGQPQGQSTATPPPRPAEPAPPPGDEPPPPSDEDYGELPEGERF